MARTDRDSWDLATSVGATATMVAAARAAALQRAGFAGCRHWTATSSSAPPLRSTSSARPDGSAC